MIKINYESDFKLTETTEEQRFADVPFEFVYATNSGTYTASYDGHKYVNCKPNSDHSVTVIFNNHGLGVGKLKVRREFFIPDRDFPDGVYNVVSNDTTDVILVEGKTEGFDVEETFRPPYVVSEGSLVPIEVVDSLDSDASDKALSANQGRILNERINVVTTDVEEIDESIKNINETLEHTNAAINENTTNIASNAEEIIKTKANLDALEGIVAEKADASKVNQIEIEVQKNTNTISNNTARLVVLEGDGEGSIKKTVAEGIADVVANAPEDLNTLKEVADYIASDKTKASEIEKAISDLGVKDTQLENSINANATAILSKQPLLTGDEFKTINSESIMGSGDIELPKVDIINDLTTGGTDKALSAEMGKELDKQIGNIIGIEASVIFKGASIGANNTFFYLSRSFEVVSGESYEFEVNIDSSKTFVAYLWDSSTYLTNNAQLRNGKVIFQAFKSGTISRLSLRGEAVINGYVSHYIVDRQMVTQEELCGYQFMGVATLSTKPNTTEAKIYYEASDAGEYPDFGGIVVYSGEVAHLKWDGTSWSKEVSASGDVVYPALRNGTPENSGNAVSIRGNQVIPVRKGDCVYAKFHASLEEGEKLLYCFSGVKAFTKTTDIGTNRTEGRSYGVNDIESNNYVITKDNTVGVIVYVVKKNSDGTYGSLQPYTGYGQGTLEVCVVRAIGNDIEKIIDNSRHIERNNRRFATIGLSPAGSIKNGGAGNSTNGYKVRTSGIDVRGIKRIRLYTDRPNAEGAIYRYEYICSSDVSSIGAYYSANDNPNGFTVIRRDEALDASKSIDMPDNAASIAVAIYEIPSDGKEGDIILRVADFENYDIGVIHDSNSVIEDIQNIKDTLGKLNDNGAYSRNIHKTIALGAACRQRKSSNTSKDFQIIEVVDSHDDTMAVDNAITMTNGFRTVDAIIHCGDMAGNYITPQSTMTTFINSMKKSIKPWFNVVGNHEAGTYNMVGYVPSIQHMYNTLIAPIVEAGHLIEGEYQVGKCHYFHDFSEHKIRLICVNEYDGDLAFDTEYWEAVPYDSSATAFAFNTQYKVGDIVKMQYYTEYCFRCVKSAITGSSIFGLSGQEPKYKIRPGSRMISQEQAEWFVDTLKSTPEGHAVIIAMHNPFSDKAVVDVSKKFSENRAIAGSAPAQNAMVNDFFADIVDAFIKGLSYSEYISFKNSASYRNVNIAPDGTQYVYQLNVDFSQKQANTKFMCYLGGHVHNDLIWHHPTYSEQWQVTPVCAATSYHQSPISDIRRSNIDGSDYDSVTCISFNTSDRAISLVKIGVDVTENMEYRDFEKIVL